MARSRRTLGLVAGLAVVVLGVVAFAGWWFFIRDDAPEEASIDTATETLEGQQPDTTTGDTAAAGGVDGTWAVDPSVGSFDDFSGTWAGYRVKEELSGIGSNTAVGRTPDVTGTMTVENGQVTGVEVKVDVTTLQSDSGTRDAALKGRGLQSDQFPDATFKLTQPVAVPEGVEQGQQVSGTAQGELTIHGVTKPVTVQVDTKMANGKVAVVGNAPVKLTDFGIEPPTGFRVLSIKDDGTFEFQIFFAKQ
jgi:polyisoprenoid-binding protein YceI